MDIFDACGDAVIELSGSLVVQRLLSRHAYGYKAGELVGRSILSCIHPNHQKAFEQTAIALLAMTPQRASGAPSPPRAVRMLHSVFCKRSGSSAEVMADSSVTAVWPRSDGLAPTLIVWSRYALLPYGSKQGDAPGKFSPKSLSSSSYSSSSSSPSYSASPTVRLRFIYFEEVVEAEVADVSVACDD